MRLVKGLIITAVVLGSVSAKADIGGKAVSEASQIGTDVFGGLFAKGGSSVQFVGEPENLAGVYTVVVNTTQYTIYPQFQCFNAEGQLSLTDHTMVRAGYTETVTCTEPARGITVQLSTSEGVERYNLGNGNTFYVRRTSSNGDINIFTN